MTQEQIFTQGLKVCSKALKKSKTQNLNENQIPTQKKKKNKENKNPQAQIIESSNRVAMTAKMVSSKLQLIKKIIYRVTKPFDYYDRIQTQE